jgi:hypothetical protein
MGLFRIYYLDSLDPDRVLQDQNELSRHSKFNFKEGPMNLVSRITNITMRPKEEWPVIAEEQETVQSLFTNVILLLAAIGPVCSALNSMVFGHAVWFGARIRPAFGAILAGLIIGYALTLLGVFITSFIIHKLAPNFESEGDLPQAMKLVTYSYVPVWVAGVLNIIPFLGVLTIFVGLYGLYLAYLGLPVIMKTPPDKVVVYLIVVIVIGIVISVIMGTITAAVVAAGMFAGGSW